MKPALVVVAAAAAILAIYGVLAALTGSSAPKKAPTTKIRTSLAASPAAKALRPIEDPGTPPSDVLRALAVPAHAVPVSKKRWDGLSQYSATMGFTLAASQGAVVRFYRSELKGRGWSITSVGPAHGDPRSTEVLAQLASNDGWYWGVGVVVSPTSFAAHSGAEHTRFVVDLYEVLDAQ